MNQKPNTFPVVLLGFTLGLAADDLLAKAPEPSARPELRAEATSTQHDHRKQKGVAVPTDEEGQVPAPAAHAHDHRDQKGMAGGGDGTMSPDDDGDVGGHDHKKAHK